MTATEAFAIRETDDHHVVHFYGSESELLIELGRYVSSAIRSDEIAIVVATESHRQGLVAELQTLGLGTTDFRTNGQVILLDARTLMGKFVNDGTIDRAAFHSVVGEAVREQAQTGLRVRIFGEIVSLLWDAGDVVAAIELESLWNDLGDIVPFSLYCAYRADSVLASEKSGALRQVCELHSSVVRAPAYPGPARTASLSEATTSAHFPKSIESPRAARHFVVEEMQGWDCDPGLLDDAALVVTELAANAVVHARSEFTVVLSAGMTGVRIAVHDNEGVDEARLIIRTGRGLGLVSRLSRSWGADRADCGKVVWAILSAEGSDGSNVVGTR